MEKLLENLQAVHRFLIVATIALAVLGLSISPYDSNYAGAAKELAHLETALKSAYDKLNEAYEKIYDASDLHDAIVYWCKGHGVNFGRKLAIQTLLPRTLAAPNPEKDTTVTVGEAVAWADSAYHGSHGYIGIPMVVCDVRKSVVTAALDSVFATAHPAAIGRVIARITESNAEPRYESDYNCSISVEYADVSGRIHSTKRLRLVESGDAVTVDSVDGIQLYEYDVAGLFKGEEFGDWEDSWAISVPAIREVWSEISGREIPDAFAYLGTKTREENEKSRLKIEFLGASLDAPLALMVASVVVLGLQLSLVTYMIQIRHLVPGNEKTIRDSVLLGVAGSRLGIVVIVSTILLFPTIVSYLDLIVALRSVPAGRVRTEWLFNSELRFLVVGAIAVTGLILLTQMLQTVSDLQKWENRKKFISVSQRRLPASMLGGTLARLRHGFWGRVRKLANRSLRRSN